MPRTHTDRSWITRVGTAALCSLGLPVAALAAPPADTARPLHLDLRPPVLAELAGLKATGQETLVHRFRREGLPIARLWENHAALLSLGFSPRGKPGLWLIQKTH